MQPCDDTINKLEKGFDLQARVRYFLQFVSNVLEFLGNFLGIFKECFENFGGFFLDFFQTSIRILQEFFRNSFAILSEFYRNSLEIKFLGNSWKFFENSLRILSEFFEISLGILVWVLILGNFDLIRGLMGRRQNQSLEARG